MKKLLIIVIIAIIFAGCEKKTNEINVIDAQPSFTKAKPGNYGGTIRKLDYNLGYCVAEEDNCHPTDIVVEASQYATMSNILKVIENGDENDIIHSFKKNRIILETYIDKYYIDATIDRKYNLKSLNNDKLGIKHMIFYSTSTGKDEMVYPFILK